MVTSRAGQASWNSPRGHMAGAAAGPGRAFQTSLRACTLRPLPRGPHGEAVLGAQTAGRCWSKRFHFHVSIRNWWGGAVITSPLHFMERKGIPPKSSSRQEEPGLEPSGLTPRPASPTEPPLPAERRGHAPVHGHHRGLFQARVRGPPRGRCPALPTQSSSACGQTLEGREPQSPSAEWNRVWVFSLRYFP